MNHFNQVANSWDTPQKTAQSQMYAERIRRLIQKTDFENVLEIGCGTGLLGQNFIAPSTNYLGLDTSAGMLDVLKKKFSNGSNVRTLVLDLETHDLPIEFGSFDLIISSMAFHHLINPEKMIVKLKSLCAPGGSIAIIDLDKENGLFHPDSKAMGVQHFGFSDLETQAWAKLAHAEFYKREIINTIKKESGEFPVFLSVFK